MGIITFSGVSSATYGIQVERPPEYETPEREYDVTPIPGRNGDIVQDNGSYKNVNRAYEIAIGSLEKTYTSMAKDIGVWLHSSPGYRRLEDSYEPDYFRFAMYKEGNVLSNLHQHAGRTKINFNCKPQRYLKTGETAIIASTTPKVIANPTNQIALPLIRVKGSGAGVLNVGGYTVTISSITSYIDIDSEVQDAYSASTTNLNLYVTLSKGYPKLIPGNNTITFSGGITSVEVTPRWWTI